MSVLSGTKLHLAFASSALCLLLAACGHEQPQSTTTPRLDTGITSSSGGGMQNSTAPLATRPQ